MVAALAPELGRAQGERVGLSGFAFKSGYAAERYGSMDNVNGCVRKVVLSMLAIILLKSP